MDQERFDVGREARGRVLGEEYVTRAFANADSFNLEFQQLVTEYCWGEIWGRSVLTDKQRSLNNLCLLAALNRSEEFKTHFRGAIHNGATLEELRDTLMQIAVYAGIPAGVEAFRLARQVLDAEGITPDPAARCDDVVGFVGLGNMGQPMATNVASRLRARLLRRRRHARTPPGRRPRGGDLADVFAGADTVLLSVPDGAATRADRRRDRRRRRPPRHHRRRPLDRRAAGRRRGRRNGSRAVGVTYTDGPVSGGVAGARAATISMMFAGPADVLEANRPVLEAIAGNVFHVGTRAGQGQAMKLLNNYLSATALAATSEAIAFGVGGGPRHGRHPRRAQRVDRAQLGIRRQVPQPRSSPARTTPASTPV